jgi:hypothetical protein
LACSSNDDLLSTEGGEKGIEFIYSLLSSSTELAQDLDNSDFCRHWFDKFDVLLCL